MPRNQRDSNCRQAAVAGTKYAAATYKVIDVYHAECVTSFGWQ